MLLAAFVIHQTPEVVALIPAVMAQLARFSNKHFGYAQVPMNGGCA
jgi:hypothetical protein